MTDDEKLLSSLDREIDPPADLEDRVVRALAERHLLDERGIRRSHRWRTPLAAAASIALMALGVAIGRATVEDGIPGGTVTGTSTDVYALLLFENESYDAPEGPELMNRYGEYNRWVASAYQRGQFLAGEDLEATEGWMIQPSGDGPAVSVAASIGEDAPLSGIFFIRADNPEHALELARALPHLSHGGKVVVQRTVPTVSPPES